MNEITKDTKQPRPASDMPTRNVEKKSNFGVTPEAPKKGQDIPSKKPVGDEKGYRGAE